MISYEASKWYIKLWRMRWYFYAIFLLLINILTPSIIIEYLINRKIEKETEQKIEYNWKTIKRHVELSKMYKFSSKDERTD